MHHLPPTFFLTRTVTGHMYPGAGVQLARVITPSMVHFLGHVTLDRWFRTVDRDVHFALVANLQRGTVEEALLLIDALAEADAFPLIFHHGVVAGCIIPVLAYRVLARDLSVAQLLPMVKAADPPSLAPEPSTNGQVLIGEPWGAAPVPATITPVFRTMGKKPEAEGRDELHGLDAEDVAALRAYGAQLVDRRPQFDLRGVVQAPGNNAGDFRPLLGDIPSHHILDQIRGLQAAGPTVARAVYVACAIRSGSLAMLKAVLSAYEKTITNYPWTGDEMHMITERCDETMQRAIYQQIRWTQHVLTPILIAARKAPACIKILMSFLSEHYPTRVLLPFLAAHWVQFSTTPEFVALIKDLVTPDNLTQYVYPILAGSCVDRVYARPRGGPCICLAHLTARLLQLDDNFLSSSILLEAKAAQLMQEAMALIDQ
jgi:hypothetical protein